MTNTTGSLNIFTIALEIQRVYKKQEKIPSEDSRTDTPAWNRASYMQSSANLRSYARSDRGISEREKSSRDMDEAVEAVKGIRKARRSFAKYKTKMTSLGRPDGTVTALRRAMKKVIHDLYSDLFGSHVSLPTYNLGQDEYIAPLFSLPKYDVDEELYGARSR
nr:unnamed protein product [Haemonchus contortus]